MVNGIVWHVEKRTGLGVEEAQISRIPSEHQPLYPLVICIILLSFLTCKTEMMITALWLAVGLWTTYVKCVCMLYAYVKYDRYKVYILYVYNIDMFLVSHILTCNRCPIEK